MCEPVSLASAAMMVAGTVMQARSQAKAQKAISSAINANGEANDALRRQSQAGVLDAAGNFDRTKFDQKSTDETVKINRDYTDQLSQGDLPGEFYGGAQSENTIKNTAQKTEKSNEYAKQIAEALAKMRGFESGIKKENIGINRAGEVVGMNNSFQSGNNAILPLQIEAAKKKGSNPLADIMTGVGSAGLGAGLSNVAGSGILGSQGALSRTVAGMGSNVQGPVQGWGGFNLI